MFTILFSTTAIGSLAGALFTARRTVIEVHNVVFASASFGVAMLVLAKHPLGMPFAAADGGNR